MSLEIITGKTGEPHIDSEDIGAYNAYTIGKDSYLLNGLDMSITNVNTLHVGTGEVLFQGRHIRIKGNGEDVAIANGTTGYKRNDILCLKYQKFPQNSDIESISLELVKGTPTTGTPADPAITTGSILNGDTVVYLKLARIVVNGLTPAAPVKLLGTVKTLAETNTSLAATAQTVAQIGASIDSKTAWMLYEAKGGLTGTAKYLQPGGWEACTIDAVFGSSNYADFFEFGTALGVITFKKSGYYRISPRFTFVGAGAISCRILNGSTEECFGASTNDSTSRNNTTQCSYITYINAGDTRTIQCACDNKINRFLSAAFSHVDVEYLGA